LYTFTIRSAFGWAAAGTTLTAAATRARQIGRRMDGILNGSK